MSFFMLRNQHTTHTGWTTWLPYVGPEVVEHLFGGFSRFLGAIAAYATSNGSTNDLG